MMVSSPVFSDPDIERFSSSLLCMEIAIYKCTAKTQGVQLQETGTSRITCSKQIISQVLDVCIEHY